MDLPDPADALAFGPHPDDVEIWAGGLILRLVDQGRRVVVVDLTRGERGSRGSPETRAREAALASRRLGIVARENLGLPDAGLEDGPDQVTGLVAAIRRWRPRVVIGPADDDLHPDHVAAAGLVRRAYYLATMGRVEPTDLPPHRPDVLLRYPGQRAMSPDLLVDVSDVWTRRTEVIEAYASQLGLDGAPGPVTNLTASDARRRFEVTFGSWGARIGAAYAEPYLVDRPVPVDDVVETFRKRGQAVL